MPATYQKIATTTLGSASANINFSSISSAYTDLRIVFVGNYSVASRGAITYNSDTATNYSNTRLTGDGSAAASAKATNAAYILMGLTDISNLHTYQIDVFSYAGSTFKTCLINLSSDNNGSGYQLDEVGLWRSTSAITSIQLKTYDGTNLAAGSTATLYGILKA
jgi:hypothetical protein